MHQHTSTMLVTVRRLVQRPSLSIVCECPHIVHFHTHRYTCMHTHTSIYTTHTCKHAHTFSHSHTHMHAHILFLSLSHTHICTHIYTCHTQTHTYTERTKMMNTWYKLFNIISTHMKRTCIHSCSVRSLIITHAIHTLPVMIIIIQHCLSLPSILANQTHIHTKSKTKLSSQFSTELKKHVKKCISVHPKTSEFQCKLAEDIACSLELKFCYVQN